MTRRFKITDEKPSLNPLIGMTVAIEAERLARMAADERGRLASIELARADKKLHEAQAMICALHIRDERQTAQLAELYKNLETMARFNATARAENRDAIMEIERLNDVITNLWAAPKRRAGRKVKP